jgi:hypothetical protein
MALSKRTFRINVQYWSEDVTSFDTMKDIAVNAAQELFAAGLLASGGAAKQPIVEIFTDHSASGTKKYDRDGIEVLD